MNPLLALSAPGWPEMIFIFILIVLLFGSKKIPELARSLGQSLGEFKKAKDEFEHEIRKSTSELDAKEQLTGNLPEIKEPADKQPHKPA